MSESEGHPAGELSSAAREVAREAVKLDTFGGTVHVEWDPDAAATPLGHLAFFAEYLKVSGRFDALVADCPLYYTSPNAPSKRDVLGTVMLSVLVGQSRYAHITALRGDGVNPALLSMSNRVTLCAHRGAPLQPDKSLLQNNFLTCRAPMHLHTVRNPG